MRRLRQLVRISLLAVLLALILAGPAAGAVAKPFPAAGSTTPCHATPVHLASYHGKTFRLAGVPWVATSRQAILGFLFFRPPHATGEAALLHAGGTMPNGASTKILWVITRSGGSRHLTIKGRNLTGPGTMRETVPGSSGGGGNYPSIVTIPAAGCWRLALRSGSVRGTVTLPVVASNS